MYIPACYIYIFTYSISLSLCMHVCSPHFNLTLTPTQRKTENCSFVDPATFLKQTHHHTYAHTFTGQGLLWCLREEEKDIMNIRFSTQLCNHNIHVYTYDYTYVCMYICVHWVLNFEYRWVREISVMRT